MPEIVTIERPQNPESKEYTGFNLDLMIAFDYKEEAGNGAELTIDFAAPCPLTPTGPTTFYKRVYLDKEAKALIRVLVDASRVVRLSNRR